MSRDQILEAAALIFSQKGFHGTSMQDIADEVHLQKASLYHHVSSKQEILVDVLDKALDLLIDRMQAVLDLRLPPDQKLRQAMRTYLLSLAEHHDLASVLLLEHRSLESQYHLRHIPRRDRFESLWRTLIQEGQDSGIYNGIDPEMATRALLGVMNWTITWFRPDGQLTVETISDLFADLFLQGLQKRTNDEIKTKE
jgi:AcrR family transcriptional regulator